MLAFKIFTVELCLLYHTTKQARRYISISVYWHYHRSLSLLMYHNVVASADSF